MFKSTGRYQATNGSPHTRDVGDKQPSHRAWSFVRQRAKSAAGLGIIGLLYLVAAFADFLAPYDYRVQFRREPLAPPTTIHVRDARNNSYRSPFVYARRLVDPFEHSYSEDTRRAYSVRLFTHGYSYKLLGLFTSDTHLFGVHSDAHPDAPRAHLLGTDALGRDRLSRLLIASRFSLVTGPLAALFASVVGTLLGCIAGYAGRTIDTVMMRTADTMMALPTLVLMLAARAAFPLELPPKRAMILLITIFVTIGWAEMARLARGQVMTLRRREFVFAAEALGLSPIRVLFRHILPNAARPLIVQMSLMLPAFLLAETGLSFLGVGLQEPEASWGNMLAAASDITLLRLHPFLLLTPAFAIFLFVFGARLFSDDINRRSRT